MAMVVVRAVSDSVRVGSADVSSPVDSWASAMVVVVVVCVYVCVGGGQKISLNK